VTPTRITSLDDPQLRGLFSGIRASWFRLEALQRYDVSYERAEFEAFLRGEDAIERGPWEEMISAHAAAGKRLERVHVITEPLTDYIRYELAYYQVAAAAGEDVRLIPVPAGGDWPAGVPRLDYWLLDDRDVWTMAYDADGRFRQAMRARGMLLQARRWRNAALAQSVPLADYALAA